MAGSCHWTTSGRTGPDTSGVPTWATVHVSQSQALKVTAWRWPAGTLKMGKAQQRLFQGGVMTRAQHDPLRP